MATDQIQFDSTSANAQVDRAGDASVLRRLWHFAFGWGPPHALGLFRIAFGCYFLAYWLSVLPDIPLHFACEGMAFPLFERPTEGILNFQGLIATVTQPPTPGWAWAAYCFTLTLCLLFTVGLYTRFALFLYLVMFAYFYFVQIHARDTSFDRLLFIVTGLLWMGRSDAALSVSSWLRHRRGGQRIQEIPLWPARAIALQIAIMYFGASAYKVLAEPWCHGEMLYYTFMGNWASPRAFWLVRTFPQLGLYDLMVFMTMVMELYAPILLFHRRRQKLVFLWGIVFHILIADLLSIWPFMFMPLTYVLFVDPARVRECCASAFGRRSKASALGNAYVKGKSAAIDDKCTVVAEARIGHKLVSESIVSSIAPGGESSPFLALRSRLISPEGKGA
jgi:uncharacterized membrane protein YphA (DoxX/SURF4 family)